MRQIDFLGVFQKELSGRRTSLIAAALAAMAHGPVAFAAPCHTPSVPTPGQWTMQPAAGQPAAASGYSKGDANLQGTASRLDQIRKQQAGKSATAWQGTPETEIIVRIQALPRPVALSDALFSLPVAGRHDGVDRPLSAVPANPSLAWPRPQFLSEFALAQSPFPAHAPLALDGGFPSFDLDSSRSGSIEPSLARRADCPAPSVPSYAYEQDMSPPLHSQIRPGQPDIFGTVALSVSRTGLDRKWRQASGAVLAGRAGPWAAVIAQNRNLPRAAQIRNVNAWVNARIAYVDDARQYGIADQWASAVQSLTRGRGDCEDYAIAKMQILRALGVAADSMFLVIARDLVRRADHAILAVAVDGDLLVLDNETDTILPSAEVRDYRPVLSFNGTGSWTHGYRTAPSAAALRFAALTR